MYGRWTLWLGVTLLLAAPGDVAAQDRRQASTTLVLKVPESAAVAITTPPVLQGGSDRDAAGGVYQAAYAVSTNASSATLTVALGQVLPLGVTVRARLHAPPGAQSLGWVTLGPMPVSAVTGVGRLAAREQLLELEVVGPLDVPLASPVLAIEPVFP